MKRIYILILLIVCNLVAFGQRVSNARFEQVGKQVRICYDLSSDASIEIYLSTDGGKTFEYSPLRSVTGDVGKKVLAGYNRCAMWDVLSDKEKLQGNNITFKIRAVPLSSNQTFTVNGVSFTMVFVEGGTFTMGATSEQGDDAYEHEYPTHRVTLSDYYIGETEVTQALWQAVMGSNPSYFKGDNLPVEQVSYDDVKTFITKLNQKTGKTFRLPTEAEWEYAARGGKKSKGYKYAGSNNIDDVAWYYENSGNKRLNDDTWNVDKVDNNHCRTHPVKTKRPNELGIYDMSGNVWEWCSDNYGAYSSSSQTNPTGPSSGSCRVYRGGSWLNDARGCRASDRYGDDLSYLLSNLGFRLALAR